MSEDDHHKGVGMTQRSKLLGVLGPMFHLSSHEEGWPRGSPQFAWGGLSLVPSLEANTQLTIPAVPAPNRASPPKAHRIEAHRFFQHASSVGSQRPAFAQPDLAPLHATPSRTRPESF